MEFKVNSTASEKSCQESVSESSSIEKTKLIRKSVQRKKLTKIIHNVCIHYTKPDGQSGFIHHKKVVDTTEEDETAIQRRVQSGVEKFQAQVISQNYLSFINNQVQKSINENDVNMNFQAMLNLLMMTQTLNFSY